MPTDAPKKHVWLITGTSQGFGRDLVRVALDRGDSVVATSRQPDKVTAQFPNAADRLLALPMDLTDNAQIASVAQQTLSRFGSIDVLINNAGHGMLGAIEETADAEVAKVFELNVFGLLRVTRAVLPIMRKQKSGTIVNLSSIGGLIGIPGWGIYNGTKFAVEGISEALSYEAAPLGIKVMIVEPGPFRTDFLGGSLSIAANHLPDYDATAGKTREYQQANDGKQAGDPLAGAKAIVDAAVSENPPLRLLLGKLAYDRATAKLEATRKQFEAWRDVAIATDFKK